MSTTQLLLCSQLTDLIRFSCVIYTQVSQLFLSFYYCFRNIYYNKILFYFLAFQFAHFYG